MLWTISVVIGAFQNNIYAELATMFKDKPGGIALFAHEAWRKYFTPIGPLATFGYWFAWSSVLAVNGLVVGTLIQAEFFSDATWAESGAGFDLNLRDRARHRRDRPGLGVQRPWACVRRSGSATSPAARSCSRRSS